MKNLIKKIFIIILIIMFFSLILIIQLYRFIHNNIDINEKYDYIIVLGGSFKYNRENKGILLYKKNYANKIIITGYDNRNYYIENGVKKEDLIFLKQPNNTYTEIKTLKKFLKKEKVILISTNEHLNRIKLLINYFQLKNINLIGVNYPKSYYYEYLYFLFREACALYYYLFKIYILNNEIEKTYY